MQQVRLTFLQTFNAMRTFLNMYYDQTQAIKIGVLAGGLNVWNKNFDSQIDPITFDPQAWDNWLKSVHQILINHNINVDPKEYIYDEDIGFLCMQNYFQSSYNQILWQDLKDLVEILKRAQHIEFDPVWEQWLQAITHVLNNSYELDVYFDPFTGDRM